MSSNIFCQLQVPERSRSCIGLSTPLTSRNSSTKLYRSLSFNSPGSMDRSIDDNINELSHHMSAQMSALEEKITNIDLDRRYNNTRTEKAIIENHCLNLEEKLLDAETRFAEKIAEQQRRYKELQTRMQREIKLLTENKAIALKSLEEENLRLREDVKHLRATLDRKDEAIAIMEDELREVRADLIEQVQQASKKLFEVTEERRKDKISHGQEKEALEEKNVALEEKNNELKEKIRRLRNVRKDTGLLENLQSQISDLRESNKFLQDTNEELQATMFDHNNDKNCGSKHCEASGCNLAAELEAFVSEQADLTMSDMQEENSRLRNYLESLLLKIIGHYPQILEIKSP